MPPYAFFHKQFMPLSEAKIGVLTHALHYGTACFEGIRGNWDSERKRLCLFRVQDHYKRMLDGARLLRMNLPYSVDELCQLTVELVERSGYQENVYIRPLVYKSSESIGVRLHDLEDDFVVIVTTLPPYLAAEEGVRCCTSSWRRINDTMVPRGKICGAYVNGALAKSDACEGGFDEAILLTHDGHVAEGSGENIFLVSNGNLITPSSLSDILIGITRDTVIKLAKNELGLETIERQVYRSELYLAEECFFTGTATNIAPVVEIDHRPVNTGEVGKITSELQKLFAPVILGRNPKYPDWCTLVSPEPVKA
ncbi:MAG: branched-chain amino acid transaminase [Dehalococcoidia bacterium]|nr:branched-chain amino acid transaminase [Dehalococcoidia bacterium]